MKRIFSLFAALFLLAGLSGQELPPPREIPREYRPEYRDLRRETLRSIREAEEAGFDIILDPIEAVPVRQFAAISDFTNWGYTLLVADLEERIRTECSYTVILDVCDTAGETDHPDLSRITTPARNYSSSPGLPDKQGHGTHCAGIAFGRGGGIASALVDAGLLLPKLTKVLSDQGSGSFAQVANMQNGELPWYQQQIEAGFYVVQSWSFGGGTSKPGAVEDALKRSSEAGVLTVAASGNNNGAVSYPGNSDYTFAVGSIGQSLKRSSFSNYGPELNLSAPGERINSTYPGKGYAVLSGTSMATPMVAAVAAIAYSKWGPKLQPVSRARDYLEAIATDLGDPNRDDLYGWGLAYVRSVLDNDPDDVLGGGPDPEPEPEPEPDQPGKVNTFSIVYYQPYAMLWGYQFGQWQSILVEEMQISITGAGTVADQWQTIQAFIPRYFTNRGIVLPEDQTVYDAAYWTGQFLEYIARQEGLNIQIDYLKATDGAGLTYWVRGFDKAIPTASDGAYLLPLDQQR